MRDDLVITSLDTVVKLEHTVYEYRKLVLGLVGRICTFWNEHADFFSAAVDTDDLNHGISLSQVEKIEKLFCFPKYLAHPQSYDFERFAYNCPQYYLRQAIDIAITVMKSRARSFVRRHYESSDDVLTVTDLLWSSPLQLFGKFRVSPSSIIINLFDSKERPQDNFHSHRGEVFTTEGANYRFQLKLFDRASGTWKWCEGMRCYDTTGDWVHRWKGDDDPISVPREIFKLHQSHLYHEVVISSTKFPDFTDAREFAVFKGIELPDSFVDYARRIERSLSA